MEGQNSKDGGNQFVREKGLRVHGSRDKTRHEDSRMSLDIISIGELLIDFISTDGGVSFRRAAGGAPANVVVACSHLGLRSGFIGKVGNDEFGQFLRDTLKREGVDVSKVRLDRKVGTTLAFVWVDKDGERRFKFRRGADALLELGEVDDDYVRGSRVFHFGSISLISEPSRSATLKAVKVAKKNSITITYDPNLRLNLWKRREMARHWMMAGLRRANVVKLNEEEIRFMFGSSIEDGADELLRFADKVFISLGRRGCYYADKDSRGYSKPYKIGVRDTTGAGDGFMGGIIYGNLKGWGVEKTASFSNAVGALTASKLGGIPSMPALGEVLQLMQKR